ncbi:MAG: chaperonin 10-like protein [Lentinula lateritia]|uniref:Chaperonin 10-like protein n=1 Tax=Lentinula lateritia TaxID=40482 RepID=A0ABQ8VNY2_9AGAR|nr:MAG: chaperonin 10-like protein [Lentinula lateritia]KAJ4497160.1 chaperonin 10-like protein [Lentinula lateritia]
MSLENRVQKALVLESPKTPFVLKTVPIPKPGPGEVLVKIIASGLNPVDWFIQSRDLFAPNTPYPAIIGLDMAGDVEEVGEGVKEISRGDRVFLEPKLNSNEYASHQKYALAPVEFLGKIPENLSYGQAACIPLTFSTAVYGLLPAHPVGMGLNPTFDDTVTYPSEVALVIGGSTSVGQYAIQILKYLGFGTIIVYASTKHTEYLKSLGATHFIDRNEISFADLPAALPKVCSQPIKIIYTAVTSPEAQNAAYACLADDGKLAIATPRLVSWGDAEITTKKVYGVFGGPHIPPNREFGITLWKHLPRLLERGVFVPNRIEEIPNGLSGVVDGVKKYEKGEVNGVKLIVFPQDTPA